MKTLAIYGVMLLASCLGLAIWIGPVQSQDQEQAQPNGEVQRLLVERRDTLRQRVEALDDAYNSGSSGVVAEDLIQAREALYSAELELATSPDERIAIFQRRVENLRSLEDVIKQRGEASLPGGETTVLLAAKAARLKAESDLLEAQTKRLLVERRDTLRELVEAQEMAFSAGLEGVGVDEISLAQDTLLRAELVLANTKAERVVFYQAKVDVMRALENTANERQQIGLPGGERAVVLAAKAARLKAEADLLEARSKSD